MLSLLRRWLGRRPPTTAHADARTVELLLATRPGAGARSAVPRPTAAPAAGARGEPVVPPDAEPAESAADGPTPTRAATVGGAPTAGEPGDDPRTAEARAVDAATAAVRRAVDALRDAHAGAAGDDVHRLLDAVGDAPLDSVRQLPAAAHEALTLCDDPSAGVAELTRLCGTDPTLAQALLRHANSAWYARAGRAPAVALREAIDRVGIGGVRGVLLDVVVHGLLCQPGGELAQVAEAVWTHGARTAPIARALAPAFGTEPERCYALGLLHDVGKLVLLDQAAALRARQRRTPQLSAPFVRDALRALHEPLGALAALRWGIGEVAAGAIGRHHRSPLPAGSDPIGEVLFVAERADLAATRGTPLDLDALWAVGALQGSRERAARALDALAGAPVAA